jgi:hypothetical protein
VHDVSVIDRWGMGGLASAINSAPGRMHYRDQWKIIASRIQGLMRATELHARFLAVRSSDSYGRTKSLREQGEQVMAELSALAGRFRDALPAAAVSRIEEFVKEKAPLLRATDGSPDTREELAWAGLVHQRRGGRRPLTLDWLCTDKAPVPRAMRW